MLLAPRNGALDVLRAIAVILVLGRHAPPPGHGESALLRAVMEPWIRGGWAGVDLFFVTSGFLVAGLLFGESKQTGTMNVARFLIRRGFKIYPAFYFMLVVTVAVMLWRGTFVSAARIGSEVFFLQNYLPGVWSHTWTLAVEEHFYLSLALLLPIFMRSGSGVHQRLRTLLLAYGFVAGGCLWLRVQLALNQPYSHETHLFPTHLRIDSLFFGVVLAYLHHFHGAALRRFVVRHRALLSIASGALFSLPFVLELETVPFVASVGLTLIAWGAGGLLLVAYYTGIPRNLPFRFLAYVGANSYSVYLWHLPVLAWATAPILALTGVTPSYTSYLSIYIIACLVVGIVAARSIELPALRFRNRFFPSRIAVALTSGTSSSDAVARR